MNQRSNDVGLLLDGDPSAQSHEGIFCYAYDPPLNPDGTPAEILAHMGAHARLVDCNEIYARARGGTRADLLGRTAQQVLPGFQRSIRRLVDALIENDFQVLGLEMDLPHADGRTLRVRMSCLGVWQDGLIVRAWGLWHDVTAERAAQARATEASSLLRTAFEHAPNGMAVVDLRTGRFAMVNDRICAFLGVTREQALNVQVGELGQELLNPDDLLEARRLKEQILAGGSPGFECVLRFNFPDRGEVWGRLSASLSRDADGALRHLVCQIVDLTEQRATESERRRRELDIRLSQEVLGFGSWEISLMDGEVRVSEALHRLFNLKPAHHLRRSHWRELLHPEDREATVAAFIAGASDIDPFTVTFRVVLPGGAVRWIESKAQVLRDDQGRPERVLGVSQDITARRAREEEHRLFTERLRERQRLETIGVLAGGIAHDFNTILAAIRASAELVEMQTTLSESSHRHLSRVLSAVHRGTELIDQLLTFARHHEVQAQRLDLNAHVCELMSLFTRLIPAEVRLEALLASETPHISMDSGHLSQVLMNLVVNARDAMPEGGRLVLRTAIDEVDAPRGKALGVPAGAYALLEVSDEGEGMDAETRRQIFDPFFTTRGPDRGTGLGLSTVYGIIQQANGTILVDSTPGEGTTFTVLLPLPPGDAPP
ncbi:MAG: PAS domain S-box protein [Alphaproteobacteria bacterium]|nr:PAS domain S-box protein [Alphaproteobacteria bacterium]